jgi:protein-S-isoprenylcysteine O-methyltransferase Ste14
LGAGCSLIAARGKPLFAWITSAWLTYATVYSLAVSAFTGEAWIAVAMMLPAATLSASCAWILAGLPMFRRAKPASAGFTLGKTVVQIAIFWSVFLWLVPLLLRTVEDEFSIARSTSEWQGPVGFALFVACSALGLWSAAVMAAQGRGTPLPLDGPSELVVAGPYRFVRNPMAIAGVGQGLAVALVTGSWITAVYAFVGAFLWNATVRPLEEEDLRKVFGKPYDEYRRRVRCWWPR